MPKRYHLSMLGATAGMDRDSCGHDGSTMGREIPVLGRVMMLRIQRKDIHEANEHVGVHYHCEIVIGVTSDKSRGRFVNSRVKRHFSPELFEAWQTHSDTEVGTFENFQP
jgi:hypothetical protein